MVQIILRDQVLCRAICLDQSLVCIHIPDDLETVFARAVAEAAVLIITACKFGQGGTLIDIRRYRKEGQVCVIGLHKFDAVSVQGLLLGIRELSGCIDCSVIILAVHSRSV